MKEVLANLIEVINIITYLPDGRVTVTIDMTFSGTVAESDFDAIKTAIASSLAGVSPSDIGLSIKTTIKRQGGTTLEVKIQTTTDSASGIQNKVNSSSFVTEVNVQLTSAGLQIMVTSVSGCVKCTVVPNSAPVCGPCGE